MTTMHTAPGSIVTDRRRLITEYLDATGQVVHTVITEITNPERDVMEVPTRADARAMAQEAQEAADRGLAAGNLTDEDANWLVTATKIAFVADLYQLAREQFGGSFGIFIPSQS